MSRKCVYQDLRRSFRITDEYVHNRFLTSPRTLPHGRDSNELTPSPILAVLLQNSLATITRVFSNVGDLLTTRLPRLRCFPDLDFEAGTRRPNNLAFAVLSRMAGWTLTLMLPDYRLASTLLHGFRFWHH